MRGAIRALVAATVTAAALVVTVSAAAGSETTCTDNWRPVPTKRWSCRTARSA